MVNNNRTKLKLIRSNFWVLKKKYCSYGVGRFLLASDGEFFGKWACVHILLTVLAEHLSSVGIL